MNTDPQKTWFIYIVRCKDGTFYTGITTNLERRINEHNAQNKKSAKYVLGKSPVTLIHHETANSRADASRREHEIKSFTRAQKEALIGTKKLSS